MRASPVRIRIQLAALVLATAGAGAQEASGDAPGSPWTYGAWGGIARNSPATIWGTTGGRDVAVTAVRLGRTLAQSRALALDYSLDLVPAAWVSMPPAENPRGYICTYRNGVLSECRPPRTYQEPPAYGVGAAPLGLSVRLRPNRRVQPYVAASSGVLWFQRPVPVDAGGQRHFMLEAGGGLLIQLPLRFGLTAGYKLFHISNAGTARSNPGLDNHLFYAGLLRLPSSPRR